jgi:hypothetical protein
MNLATRFALPLALVMMMASTALGQQYRGHLRGTITDPEGNPAPGAVMRITRESDGESRRFVAGPDGYYMLADLLPGTYRIASEDDRYKGFGMRTAIAIGHDAHLDIPLGLSAVTMTADVRPTQIPLDRFSPALTTRLPVEFVQLLPLESRDYLDAASLAPGIIRSGGGVLAAGTSAAFTGFVVDGLGWSSGLTNAPSTRLPLDAISHLEVVSSSYDASYGRFAGAQIGIATRSGTNTPQAGAYGFLQPDGERATLGGYGGGPIARDRTFGFGSYQFSTVDGREGDGHLLSGRADHLFGSSRLTARASADTTAADGHAQNLGIALHTVGSPAWTNEARLGFAGGSESGDHDRAFQLANVASHVRDRHLLRAGVNLSTHSREVGVFEASATTFGLFVQDDWWLRPDLTVSAGARYDRHAPDTADEASNHLSPRLGVSWVADAEARTLVRAGYGLAFNHVHLDESTPSLDMWSVAVRRWLGRARSLEAAYLGSRGDDIFAGRGSSSYDALQVTLEERSEANVAAFLTYTYGQWSQELPLAPDDSRAPLNARHRMTASFVASLPFGDERRWFADGLAADILGNMQLTGIFRLRSGLPVAGEPDEVGESLRNLDAALVKTIWLGLTRTLEVRLETYNLTNNEASRDRRYQFGGRFRF